MKNKIFKIIKRGAILASIVICTLSISNFNNYKNKALAQSPTLSGIIINIDPNYPIPGSSVKVKMETYQFDMDTADISWYYNNKKIDGGIGKKTIEIKYPNLGEIADIRVVATINKTTNYVAGKKLGGSTINLIYEPINSYTPIWYRGSAETAEGGKVKLFAEAYLYSNNKRIDSDNLIYNWTINEEPINTISGLGKNTATIDIDPILGEAFVQLTVKSLDGIYENKTSARITANNPTLKVYYNNNDTFPKYLDYTLYMLRNEMIILAEPFNSLIDGSINNYLWTLNGVPSANQTKTLTMRRGENTSGIINFNINFENKDKLFQSAEFKGIIDYK